MQEEEEKKGVIMGLGLDEHDFYKKIEKYCI